MSTTETIRSWAVRALSLFRRRRLDARLDEELAFHLEMQARELAARGMSPEAARREARLAFSPGGSLEPVKEAYRARRGVPAFETLAQDLRFALRMMRKSPGFTAVALLSLAFGIGTNCAIFTVLDALLWKSLPVPAAGQLSVLHRIEDGEPVRLFSYSAWRRLAESPAVCTGVMAFTTEFQAMVRPLRPAPPPGAAASASAAAAAATATAGGAGIGAGARAGGGGEADEIASAQLVSGNSFALLGLGTAAGRVFTPAEDRVPGGNPVAVISYGYWQRRFARDPRVVGQSLLVNGAPVTVLGVLGPAFRGVIVDTAPDVFLPITLRDLVKYRSNTQTDGNVDAAQPVWDQVNVHWLELLARRQPGVSARQAAAALGVLFERTKQAQLGTHPGPVTRRMVAAQTLELVPGAQGRSHLRAALTRPLTILMGIAALVLLIACANVANLLLARADRRRKEMAVRLGIGAGRRRLVRQLLTESLLLAGLGCVLGVAAAALGSRVLLALLTTRAVPLDVALDPKKLAFAAAVALATGVGFGLAPALQATRVDLSANLKEGARALATTGGTGAAGGGGRRRLLPLGPALVAVQIGLSLVLLVGAGLFVRSLQNLTRVDPGFTRDRLLLISINPRLLGYDRARLDALYDRLVERLEAVPGVRSASLSAHALLGDSASTSSIVLPGVTPVPGQPQVMVNSNVVTPRYFATVGMPLQFGRGFTRRDRKQPPDVAIVNEALARRCFPGRSPLGLRFGFDSDKPRQFEIVGVVKDARYYELGKEPPPMAYLPAPAEGESIADIEVRLAGGGAVTGIAGQLRRAIAETEPGLAVLRLASMGEQLDRSLSRPRAIARLTGFFGGLALLLSAIGLYGVMSYNVARRTGEIGLRMALGAPRARVLGLILRETALLLAIGIVAGLAAALAATRLAASQLYGLSAFDPGTVAVATAVLVVVALTAGFLPARRAADTSPMEALRYE